MENNGYHKKALSKEYHVAEVRSLEANAEVTRGYKVANGYGVCNNQISEVPLTPPDADKGAPQPL